MTEEDFARAAAYALGVLEADEMAQAAADITRDPAFADAVAAWQDRLAPLHRLAGEAEPPADLWRRIEQNLRPHPRFRQAAARAAQPQPGRGVLRSIIFSPAVPWALAAAATIAAILLPRAVPPPAPQIVTTAAPSLRFAAIAPLSSAAAQGWVAHVGPDGVIEVTALGTVPRAADRDLQLWALAAGAKVPVPLGLLPVNASARIATKGLPAGAVKLLVSLEPKGGSPTGLPTGPVLYGGDVVTE